MNTFFDFIINNIRELIPIVIVPQDTYGVFLLFGKVCFITDKGGIFLKIPYIMHVCVYPNRLCYASSPEVHVQSRMLKTQFGEIPVCRVINASATYSFSDIKMFIEKHGLRNGINRLSSAGKMESATSYEDSYNLTIIFEAVQHGVFEAFKEKGGDYKHEDILSHIPEVPGVKFHEVRIIADFETVSVGIPQLQSWSSGS